MAREGDDRVTPTNHRPTRPEASDVLPRTRSIREEAAALIAESEQARLHAGRLTGNSSLLLEVAAQVTADVLAERQIRLAQPVDTEFHANGRGSSGIKIRVRLQDPTLASDATKAIVERFGGLGSADRIEVR